MNIDQSEHLLSPSRAAQIYTPIESAIKEIKTRSKNIVLIERITEFLKGDVLEHFKGDPIFYLSRHIASPNFEALRLIEIGKQYDELKIVIGQDPGDKFVSHNVMKRALAKMPISKGLTHNLDEIIEFISIIDFNSAEGEKFCNIQTKTGENFVTYHNELFSIISPNTITIADESKWVDRNHRGKLIENYKKLFAMMLATGVMFETYEDVEGEFIDQVLLPAMDFIHKTFGYRPLICDLVPAEIKYKHNWDGYPSILYGIVRRPLDKATK